MIEMRIALIVIAALLALMLVAEGPEMVRYLKMKRM